MARDIGQPESRRGRRGDRTRARLSLRGGVSECELKGGKAAGICDIPAELLKAGVDPMARGLHAVLAVIWQLHPPDLLLGVAIPLWKGKGDRWDCSNYRGITLLSIPGKVFAHILLKRIRNHLLRHQRPIQSHCGASLGNNMVMDFDFADDVAILSEYLESLVAAFDAFNNKLKSLGLVVSCTKTEIQDLGAC
ncbi:uncharacterized protein [Penaeus vannamei]|uniref:uncharacterized protein n=1 Tax=Penaeus vannamei TaxID=6689 RepID=UPI00387F8017